MPATTFAIDIAVDIPAGSPLGRDAFPHLAHAVQLAVTQAHRNWLAYAEGAPLPDGRRMTPRSGTYARSLQTRMEGDFAGLVWTDLSYAQALETGQAPWDMHRMLDTSLKVRIGKRGQRYLIIPFRWGTPGTVGFGRNVMPEAVHQAWTSGAVGPSSHIVRLGWRTSGTGAWSLRTHQPLQVRQRTYSWGSRLTENMARELGADATQSRRMAGMVRMQRPGGGPGAKHSQYLTFRTLSENSPGWQHPGQPGYHVAETVARTMRPVCEKVFAEAVRQDVGRALGGR